MTESGQKFIEHCKTACVGFEEWIRHCSEPELKVYFQRFVSIRRSLHEAISKAESILRHEKSEEDEF